MGAQANRRLRVQSVPWCVSRVLSGFLAMALRALAPFLLAVVSTADNDGHPKCGGTAESHWPFLFCFNGEGPNAYHSDGQYWCMWHTTIDIAANGCDSIGPMDCQASYICTALKCYNNMCNNDKPDGRVPETNLAPAIECLKKKCPAEAQAAEASGALSNKATPCPDGTSRLLLEAGEQHV